VAFVLVLRRRLPWRHRVPRAPVRGAVVLRLRRLLAPRIPCLQTGATGQVTSPARLQLRVARPCRWASSRQQNHRQRLQVPRRHFLAQVQVPLALVVADLVGTSLALSLECAKVALAVVQRLEELLRRHQPRHNSSKSPTMTDLPLSSHALVRIAHQEPVE